MPISKEIVDKMFPEQVQREACQCKDCGEEFEPWLNGRYLVRKVCKQCSNSKRGKAIAKYHSGVRDAVAAKDLCEKFIQVETEFMGLAKDIAGMVVDFSDENELYLAVMDMAKEERRTFEQQVLWMLEHQIVAYRVGP